MIAQENKIKLKFINYRLWIIKIDYKLIKYYNSNLQRN